MQINWNWSLSLWRSVLAYTNGEQAKPQMISWDKLVPNWSSISTIREFHLAKGYPGLLAQGTCRTIGLQSNYQVGCPQIHHITFLTEVAIIYQLTYARLTGLIHQWACIAWEKYHSHHSLCRAPCRNWFTLNLNVSSHLDVICRCIYICPLQITPFAGTGRDGMICGTSNSQEVAERHTSIMAVASKVEELAFDLEDDSSMALLCNLTASISALYSVQIFANASNQIKPSLWSLMALSQVLCHISMAILETCFILQFAICSCLPELEIFLCSDKQCSLLS